MQFSSKRYFEGFVRSNLTTDNAGEIYEVFCSLETGEETMFKNCCEILGIDRKEILKGFVGTEIFDVDEDVGLTAIAAAERFGTIEYEDPKAPSYGSIKGICFDNGNSEYMAFRQKLLTATVQDILRSYRESDFDYTDILAVVQKIGVFLEQKHREESAPGPKPSSGIHQATYTKEDVIDKIDQELEAWGKTVQESGNAFRLTYFEEIKTIREAIYNVPFYGETAQALMAMDNILGDAYDLYKGNRDIGDIYEITKRFIDMAERDYLAEKLYLLVTGEYEAYIGEVKKMPPGQIILEANKIAAFNQIFACLDPETSDLGAFGLKGLMAFENPMLSIYDGCKNDKGTLPDSLADAISDFAADEGMRGEFMARIKAFTDNWLNAGNAKQIYGLLRPCHCDTSGWLLYRAAKGILKTDVYNEFPTEGNMGHFEALNGYELLKWLEIAKFAAKEYEQLPGGYEKLKSYALDEEMPEYQEFQGKLYEAAIHSAITSLADKHPCLLEGLSKHVSYIEGILMEGLSTREGLNEKTEHGAEMVFAAVSEGYLGEGEAEDEDGLEP